MPTDLLACTEITVQRGRPPVMLAVCPNATAPDMSLLTPAERAAADGLGERRGTEYARGRTLLRQLVHATLGLPYRSIEVTVTHRGAPRLSGHPAGVSISHTDGLTAAAVWPCGPVGVDIEEPPERLAPHLVKRCCGAWADHVQSLSEVDQAAAFARVWTVQEACVKATGLGLAGIPWRIPVDPRADRGRWGDVWWVRHPTGTPTALAVAVRPIPSNPPAPTRLGEP